MLSGCRSTKRDSARAPAAGTKGELSQAQDVAFALLPSEGPPGVVWQMGGRAGRTLKKGGGMRWLLRQIGGFPGGRAKLTGGAVPSGLPPGVCPLVRSSLNVPMRPQDAQRGGGWAASASCPPAVSPPALGCEVYGQRGLPCWELRVSLVRKRAITISTGGDAAAQASPRACAQRPSLRGAKHRYLSHQNRPPSNTSPTYYFTRWLSPVATGLIKIEGNKRNHRGN